MLITRKKQSQRERILSHLKSGRTLNPKQAWNLYGCYRLSARIHDLKKAGFDIVTRLVHVDGNKYAEYSMRGIE